MMPAIQDFERRLNILHSVEPIIENAVQTLSKVIDLKNSPLEGPKPPPPPPKVDTSANDLSLDALTAVAAAPAAPSAGGIDMSQLQTLLLAQQSS